MWKTVWYFSVLNHLRLHKIVKCWQIGSIFYTELVYKNFPLFFIYIFIFKLEFRSEISNGVCFNRIRLMWKSPSAVSRRFWTICSVLVACCMWSSADQLSPHQQGRQLYQDTDLGGCPGRASSTSLTSRPERPFHRSRVDRSTRSSLRFRTKHKEEVNKMQFL